ncbi:MAG: ABC transporter ATP-binding protein [Actinomycetota bacterium]|nr:ABC transporter ATP-binding protein [Actinomycetota bacterium]
MSSDSAVAIRAVGLGKAYTIKHREHVRTLAEEAMHTLRRVGRRTSTEQFWAIRDLDVEVEQGQVLGLIGRNGAGKSTFLKLISGITPPTTGRLELFGRVGSLLEVGTGFHPELTGRENVYLNGSILGMRRREIARQFDQIVEFAGVERFLDTPVKRYSSGMYVRLAFAVAAHIDTEILLVDEVLAVGDAEFQRKCLGKMGEVASAGRTVLLVSHNLGIIEELAGRAIYLAHGRIAADGAPSEVVATYVSQSRLHQEAVEAITDAERWDPSLDRRLEFDHVRIGGSPPGLFGYGEDIEFELGLVANADVAGYRLNASVYTAVGQAVGTSLSKPIGDCVKGDQLELSCRLPAAGIAPGRYSFAVGLAVGERTDRYVEMDGVIGVLPFEIGPEVNPSTTIASWPPSWGHLRLPPVHVQVVRGTPS